MSLPVIVISGPTASGKTATSLEISNALEGVEIVNFDSLLFYRELNIGTAKPSQEEMRSCPHHLINIASAKDPLNAADFEKIALQKIQEIHAREGVPLLAGGSGFYLQALLYGMFDSDNVDRQTRAKSDELYREKGIHPFIEILSKEDPESARRYHENDHYRIRRAVEHFWTTGTKFSEKRESMMNERELNSNMKKLGWDVLHIYLDLPKDRHFQIIQRRTRTMVDHGLVEEVKSLLDQGFTGEEKPLQSIGYKEIVGHLKNGVDLNSAIERIDISTRQLAKAQRTWFKKVDKLSFNPLEDREKILEKTRSFLKIS